ncbi:MAG: hypothetical protein IKD83_01735 [Firmicutes bacterium]|nr:hypothetical protein [Bacillota bacterium]
MSNKKITPEDVGRELGLSAATVRRKMEDGSLPIGDVETDGERKSYIIYPKPLYDVTGIKLNGYEPPGEIKDYKALAECIIVDLSRVATEMAKYYSKKNKEKERLNR